MKVESFGRTAAVLLFSVLVTGTAHAVYRCGNAYQDTPCDDKGPQTHLTPGMRTAPAPGVAAPPSQAAASPYAAVCSRVGEEAQKVAWKRDAGASIERQMADLPPDIPRSTMNTIVNSVYRKRGTAPDIRAAVEAECIADKQTEADKTAAVRLLLQSRQSGTDAAAAPAAAPSAAALKTAAEKKIGPIPSCVGWRKELGSINADLRTGGSASTMERLQNRRREVEQSMRDDRC